MRVAMIGTGYVGLVSGACFSEFGTQVVCVDVNAKKIASLKQGDVPFFEPGLDQLVVANQEADRLSFTTNLKEAMEGADAVFIAVGTPSAATSREADLSFVYNVAKEIGEHLDGYKVIVTKSTVPVGTGRQVEKIIRDANPDADFDVVSNPEFLREGAAINDFMRPDRVVIGAETNRAKDVMRQLYRPLYLNETPIMFTSLETAELTKYAANAFLATKITFINEIADFCESVGADVQDVARGIGLDGRIGRKFLHPGPGYGGSCFPKDTLALTESARKAESPLSIVETVIESNDRRKEAMADRIETHCGGDLKGKTVAVLGVTFKPNTDDMRDAPSLAILPALQAKGAKLRAFDPEGMEAAKELVDGVTWCSGAYEAIDDADALLIITEWNEFRALNLDKVRALMRSPVMVDLRNIYDPAEMSAMGFHYASVGRSVARASE